MKKTILVLISLIFTLQAYDETFSDLVNDVYAKFHTQENDWCDKLLADVNAIVEKHGHSVSFVELQEGGIDPDYLDAMALEYCKKHEDSYLATIWPTMNYSYEEMIYDILCKNSTHVAYHKKFTLKNHGPKAVIQSIPEKLPHIPKDFHCYFSPSMKEYPMMCFVIRAESLKDTVIAKKTLRNIVKLDPYCMHMNDTHEQCIDLATKFLNNNSIHFLNYHRLHNFHNFKTLVPLYKQFIENLGINPDDVCVDGSCVLSVYGIRDSAMDFDFLCLKHGPFGDILPLDHHNIAWEKLDIPINDIIYNPKNFFYWNNLKFASLKAIRDFKAKQAREKDLRDVKTINHLLLRT